MRPAHPLASPDLADPLAAAACTTAPRRVEVAAVFSLPAQRLFNIMGDFASMPTWFPLLSSVRTDHSASRTPGFCDIGSVRHCTALGIFTLPETIRIWHPPHGFAYTVAHPAMPFTDHLAIVRVTATGPETCELLWTQHFKDRGQFQRLLCPSMMRLLMRWAAGNIRRRSVEQVRSSSNDPDRAA